MRRALITLALMAGWGCSAPERPLPTCQDGLDNDADGLTDWPDDPGCATPFDPDEADVAECGDGLDNDGDGLTDWPADPACVSPGSPSEADDPPGRPARCADGRDNDGDGKTDYPADPGCFGRHDDDEVDAPEAPACGNGKDDDGDGLTDFPADPGCEAASDDDELDPLGVVCGPGVPVEDITATREASGDISDRGYSALQGACGGMGPERAFRLTVAKGPVDLVASTVLPETTLDTVVYIRRACRVPTSEIACNDDANAGTKASTAVAHGVPAGTYFVVVDPFATASVGHFRLKVSLAIGQGGACDPDAMDAVCGPGLQCRPPVAGMPTSCEKPVCSDGRDNDGDGKTDFPNDPGCSGPTGPAESDPPKEPACANGVDDDGDGKTDFPADSGCDSAADDNEVLECVPGLPLRELDWAGVDGTTASSGLSFAAGSCAYSKDTAEDVYRFVIDKPYAAVTFSTVDPGTTFNTVVYVRSPSCGSFDDEKVCDDNAAATFASRVSLVTPKTGTYYVFVDGTWDKNAAGNYHLQASATLLPGTACDPAAAAFSCTEGYRCKGTAGAETCRKAACNDGMDDDADGKTDFPADPGCADISDDDEADPVPAPTCGNGIDDDFDGKTDFPADPGCTAASGGSELDACAMAAVRVLGPDGIGDTLPGGATGGTLEGGCAPKAMDSAKVPEKVYGLVVPWELSTLEVSTVSTATTVDTVLFVRKDDCAAPAAEIACNDDADGGKASRITLPSPARGSYYVIVDGKFGAMGAAPPGGPFHLTAHGIVTTGKACDPTSTQFVCAPTALCKDVGAGAFRCTTAACSDGVDDDADGRTDYPNDPGCSRATDDDELDPVPEPGCADGIDEDGDGLTDYPADPDCASAADHSEMGNCPPEVPVFLPDAAGRLVGTTVGIGVLQLACTSPGSAAEMVAILDLPGDAAYLRASTYGSTLDTVVGIRLGSCADGTTCGGSQTEAQCCSDDAATGFRYSDVLLPNRAAGLYYVVVDGWSSDVGAFQLQLTAELKPGSVCDPARTTWLACPAGLACKRADPMSPTVCAP